MTRKSTLLLATHLICSLPLVVTWGLGLYHLLGFSTILEFISNTVFLTDASLLTFVAMLAMTPIKTVTGWKWTHWLKQPLGLYAFVYAMLHFLLFSGSFQFNLVEAVQSSMSNIMLLTGLLAFLGFIPLALTSNKFAMKRLGKRWKSLHKLTYLVAILIIVHLFFLGDFLPWGVIMTALLLMRIRPIRTRLPKLRFPKGVFA